MTHSPDISDPTMSAINGPIVSFIINRVSFVAFGATIIEGLYSYYCRIISAKVASFNLCTCTKTLIHMTSSPGLRHAIFVYMNRYRA